MTSKPGAAKVFNIEGAETHISNDYYHGRGFIHYCGRRVGKEGYYKNCGRCDGRCGPNNGCQCKACAMLDDPNYRNILKAIDQQKKRWGRSKIMIVGEGRAGKTALSNSIIGKGYCETQSTVGIRQLECEVNYTSRNKDGWNSYKKPDKELESAIAAMLGSNGSTNTADSKEPTTDDSVPDDEDTKPEDAVALKEVDESLVMKCLADAVQVSADLVISVFDYGGQSVFNVIHHLFLTHCGVYVLVFNMEWLAPGNSNNAQARCLEYLQFWINSIILHTFDPVAGSIAPIVLVGTRKDQVSATADHDAISTLLYRTFKTSNAWPAIIQNHSAVGAKGTTTMCFFPVDNVLSMQDVSMQDLMAAMEKSMEANSYTNKLVALNWLKALDEMQGMKKSNLSMTEIETVATKCGISKRSIPELLHFLHEMGMLLWHDEPGLRDVIIMDAISYFVVPATVVICKHEPDEGDATHHIMPVHIECNKKFITEWSLFLRKGILTSTMLPVLWQERTEHIDVLLKLMLKFGLLVHLYRQDNSEEKISRYLVPSLLPVIDLTSSEAMDWTDESFMSCFVVFSVDAELENNTTINQKDCIERGFLPGGLFERIVGRCVMWCQGTARSSSFNLNNLLLYRNMAVMSFGSQRFRLSLCNKINCVRVDIEGRNPLAVHERLLDIIKEVHLECMKSLRCWSSLFYSTSGTATAAELNTFCFGESTTELIIPLEQLRNAAMNRSPLCKTGGRKLLTESDINRLYEPWLKVYDLRSEYDVFISYRWGEQDDQLVTSLFDMISNFSIGAENRAIEVFLDKKRLRNGRRYDQDFISALSKSSVVLPIVSVDALHRMTHHDPSEVDNVLMEWLIAIHCYKAEATSVSNVLPVLVGPLVRADTVAGDLMINNFWKCGNLSRVSDVVPTATLSQASALLKEIGLSLDESYREWTVAMIVKELLKFLGFETWQYNLHDVSEHIAISCVDMLKSSVIPNIVTADRPKEEDVRSAQVTTAPAPLVVPASSSVVTVSTGEGYVSAAAASPGIVTAETWLHSVLEGSPPPVIAAALAVFEEEGLYTTRHIVASLEDLTLEFFTGKGMKLGVAKMIIKSLANLVV